METGDKFGFRFRQIEGNTVGFGDGRRDVAEKADDLRNHMPARNEIAGSSRIDRSTMSLKLRVPAMSSTPTTESVRETS